MKEVFGTSSEIDLQMAIGLLEENNIKTSIQADGAGDSFRIYGSDLALYKKILVYYITKNILYKSQIYTVYNIFIVNVYCIDTQIVIIYVIMKILFLCILKK